MTTLSIAAAMIGLAKQETMSNCTPRNTISHSISIVHAYRENQSVAAEGSLMGKKIYPGGSTLLNNEAGFTTYDPAEEQKRTHLRSERAYSPVRPSLDYSRQVKEQLLILLRHVVNGSKKPYVPTVFKEEIAKFGSLLEWARSKPEYNELLKEPSGQSQTTLSNKSTSKKKPVVKTSKIGRIKPPKRITVAKTPRAAEVQSCTPTQQLEMLESLMEELKEDRMKPWHSEGKKRAITERYHSVRKKYDALWTKIHDR